MKSCYSKRLLRIILSILKVQIRSRCGTCVTKSYESLILRIISNVYKWFGRILEEFIGDIEKL